MVEDFDEVDTEYNTELGDAIELMFQQLNDMDGRKKQEVLALKKKLNAFINIYNKNSGTDKSIYKPVTL